MGDWRDTANLSGRQMLDLPPLWLAALLVVVWMQTRLLPDWTVPGGLARIMGGVLVLAGLALMVWAIGAFRHHRTSVVPHQTPAALITTGPFAISRNPIYLGDVMVLCGAILWWGAWPSILVIPLFVWILRRRFIAPEEARMKQNFGPEFEAYAQKTRRWL